MFDQFLKATYTQSERQKQVEKVAFMGGHGQGSWIDQFKGTPLLPKALGLMQQEIQLEQQEMADREQRDAQMESSRQMWKMRDAICLQKRMLALELAASEAAAMTGGDVPAAPPEVAMAPEPPPEAVEAEAAPEGMPAAPEPKEAAMRMKMAAGALALPKAMWAGAKQVARSASKGYGKEGLKGALTSGSKRFGTIAKMSPTTAAGMVAAPLAGVGALGIGTGAALSGGSRRE